MLVVGFGVGILGFLIMSRINLLPWRDTHRKKQNQRFYVILLLVEILCVGLIGVVFYSLKHRIQIEKANIQFLAIEQQKIAVESQLIETLQQDKTALLRRINLIQSLQDQRAKVVQLLDRLPRVVPDGICLISLIRKGDTLNLEGNANTNADISRLLKNLESKDTEHLFYQVKLTEILTSKKGSDLYFKIQCQLCNDGKKMDEHIRN